MSWHYSQALEGAFSEGASLAGGLSVQSSSTNTEGLSSSLARMMAHSTRSRFGTTSVPSTVSPGEAVLTWYQEAFLAKPIPTALEVATSRMISGQEMRRIVAEAAPRYVFAENVTRRAIDQAGTDDLEAMGYQNPLHCPFRGRPGCGPHSEPDIGYVHTPTVTANYAAPSMKKWPSCRAFVQRHLDNRARRFTSG